MAQKRKRLASESAATEPAAEEAPAVSLSSEPAQLHEDGAGKIEEDDPVKDPLICACSYVASLIYLAQKRCVTEKPLTFSLLPFVFRPVP